MRGNELVLRRWIACATLSLRVVRGVGCLQSKQLLGKLVLGRDVFPLSSTGRGVTKWMVRSAHSARPWRVGVLQRQQQVWSAGLG
ncbi:hypothetical protein DFH07DRAFT_817247 [Mycena maculata]|uniref:Secreted protein n=1 Tax=Mycena maculata TaxID=230809 RepID=A0AAD7NG29_9AGAR|nr:hypothetical protein DFH07DRAFT_817247 [Mycena maculata]